MPLKAEVVTCSVRNPACTAIMRSWDAELHKWLGVPDAYDVLQINRIFKPVFLQITLIYYLLNFRILI